MKWNSEVLVFEERKKPEYRSKTYRSKAKNKQQKTNSTLMWRELQDSNPSDSDATQGCHGFMVMHRVSCSV